MATDAAANIDAARLRDAPTLDAMLKLFADVFERSDIGPDDDFFELDGDSLTAAALMAGIERDFGVIIAKSLLLERPTPRQLTESVGIRLARERDRCLIVVRKAGRGTPLFCVHGLTGYGTFPSLLVKALPDRPLYAFRALGLMSRETPLETVPEIASRYIAEMKVAQPSGPYLLFGHCATTLIAWEMVRQLLLAGDRVAGLIMGDPLHDDVRGEIVPWLFKSGFELAMVRSRLAAEATAAAQEPDSDLLDGRDRAEWVRRILRAAVGAYAPTSLDIPVLLLVARNRQAVTLDPKHGLPSLAANLEAVVAGSNHDAVFREESGIFEAMRGFLNRVAPLPPFAAS